jgi:hypothetical protein
MSYTETHKIKFAKPAKRALQDKVIKGNFTSLFASINTKSLTVRGWNAETDSSAIDFETGGMTFYKQNPDADEYIYEAFALVTFTREDGKKPTANEFPSYLATLARRAITPQYGKWTLALVDGQPYTMPDDDEEISTNINADLVGYVDVTMPDDYESFFAHLFGRDAHVARIKGAIEAGIMSDWSNRFHCALAGPPGCGKSDICRSLQKALGEDAVMEYDATATTAAGAIKDLAERDILPRVLIVEEIEKADEKALAFLLGLMDMRGEIRKTTARATIQRNTKLLVIATINNVDLFKKLNAGALASRFSNKIGFSRPSRDQLAMILTREVAKLGDNGDERWIKPTLDYCEDNAITDPRQVISLALCGREGWLDGSYAAMLADTNMEDMEDFS